MCKLASFTVLKSQLDFNLHIRSELLRQLYIHYTVDDFIYFYNPIIFHSYTVMFLCAVGSFTDYGHSLYKIFGRITGALGSW